MKRYSAILAAVAALALCSTAKAITVGSETDVLTEPIGSADLSVLSTVTLNAGVYTYSYQVTPGGVAGAEYTGFTVYFNTSLATPGSPSPATANSPANPTISVNITPNDINWNFGGAAAQQTGVDTFSFTSTLPPTQGNAGGADTSSYGGNPGDQTASVYVPNVPDGGLTVALLGGALFGLQMFRRKMVS